MAGRSTIERHEQRAAIERAIRTGTPAAVIARTYGVSESAISRHKKMRREAVEKAEAKTEPGSADTIVRLVELADSTRHARQVADAIGSPSEKAAAQRAELAVLDRLSTQYGITDISVLAFSAMAQDMFAVVVNLIDAHPELRGDVLDRMRKRASLQQLADDLNTPIRSTR